MPAAGPHPASPPAGRSRRLRPILLVAGLIAVGGGIGLTDRLVSQATARPRSARDFPAARGRLLGATPGAVNRAIGPPTVSYATEDGTEEWVYRVAGPPAGQMLVRFRAGKAVDIVY